MLRIEIDNLAATVELENEAWSLELIETLLRMCGEEVVRTATALGLQVSADDEDDQAAGAA